MAERHDRDAILAGLKKRHCYGATEDIVLEVKCGDHVMGDEFKTAAAPKLEIRVGGTNDIKAIDILKDSKVVATLKGDGRDFQGGVDRPGPDGRGALLLRARHAGRRRTRLGVADVDRLCEVKSVRRCFVEACGPFRFFGCRRPRRTRTVTDLTRLEMPFEVTREDGP